LSGLHSGHDGARMAHLMLRFIQQAWDAYKPVLIIFALNKVIASKTNRLMIDKK
jgi:hypothetical protein